MGMPRPVKMRYDVSPQDPPEQTRVAVAVAAVVVVFVIG